MDIAGRGQTSWLFTNVAEELNSRLPRTNPAIGQNRTELESATSGFQVRRSKHSATLPVFSLAPSAQVHYGLAL